MIQSWVTKFSNTHVDILTCIFYGLGRCVISETKANSGFSSIFCLKCRSHAMGNTVTRLCNGSLVNQCSRQNQERASVFTSLSSRIRKVLQSLSLGQTLCGAVKFALNCLIEKAPDPSSMYAIFKLSYLSFWPSCTCQAIIWARSQSLIKAMDNLWN